MLKNLKNRYMRTKNSPTNIESYFIVNLEPGESFFTEKQDKDMTAASAYYNKKVRTERLIVLNHITLETNRITKVTIL